VDPNYLIVQPVEFGGASRPRLVLKDVYRVYTGQFWSWLAITAPTSLLASRVLLMADRKISEILRSFPITEISYHRLELAEAGALRYGSFFTGWFLGCFALAAITTVVNRLDVNSTEVWKRDSYQKAREHFGALLLAALFTFCAFLAGMAAVEFVESSLIRVVGWAHFSRFNFVAVLIGYTVIASIVSWFGMTIPLILSGDIGIWRALKKSLRLSNGYEGFLFLLVVESMAGSYLAWYAVHYGFVLLFPAQFRYTQWYGWVAYFVSILASAAVQPPMFIGFALLAANEQVTSSSLPGSNESPNIE